MPGLPIPLWFQERRVSGGAATTLVAGGRSVVGVLAGGGAAFELQAGAAAHTIELRLPGGASVGFSAGGGLYTVDTIAGGGAAVSFVGGSGYVLIEYPPSMGLMMFRVRVMAPTGVVIADDKPEMGDHGVAVGADMGATGARGNLQTTRTGRQAVRDPR